MEEYEIINTFVRPAYSYVEGDDKERYWLDSQNCWYHLMYDKKNKPTILGKKYWIIEPYKPGIQITEENYEEVKQSIKWLVTDTSEELDEDQEWDFERHCIKL